MSIIVNERVKNIMATYKLKDTDRRAIEFMVFDLGMENYQIDRIITRCKIKDLSVIPSKIEFLKNHFNYSYEQVSKVILRNPSLLSYTTKKMSQTFQTTSEDFSLTHEDYVQISKSAPIITGYKQETFEKKSRDLMELLNLSTTEFAKVAKKCPQLVELDIEKIKARKQFYLDRYENIDDEVFSKMVKINPIFLTYPRKTVLDKEHKYLELTQGEIDVSVFGKILTHFPHIVCHDIAKIKPRMELFEKHGFTIEEFCAVMAGFPAVIGCDVVKIEQKLLRLESLGIDKFDIISSPQIISINPDDVRVRYIINALAGLTKEKFISGNFKQRASKSYARLAHMQKLYPNMQSYPYIYANEKDFSSKVKSPSEELMRRHVLTPDIKLALLQDYNAMFQDNQIQSLDDVELYHD